MALESNLGLKQSSNSVALQQVALFKNRDSFLPNLNASIAPSLRGGRQFDSVSLSYEGAFSGSLQLGLSLNMTLFDGAMLARYKGAKLTLSSVKLDHSREEQDVVRSTIAAYVRVVIDGELVRVSEENLKAQEKQLALVEAFCEAKKATVAELYQQQAELEEARQGLLTSESDREVHKLQLIQTMGRSLAAGIEIAPLDVPDDDGEWPDEEDVEAAVKYALANRPDAGALKAKIASAGKQVDAAKAAYWPTLSLSGGTGTSYSSAMQDHFGFTDQFFNNNPYASAGLAVSIPLFDGLAGRHDMESAELQVQAEKIGLDTLAQAIEMEVRQAFESYKTAKRQLEVAAKKRKSAAQSLEAYEELYRTGGCTLVDLSQARASSLQASVDEVTTRYDLLVKAVDIAYYKGDDEELTALLKQ